MNDLHLWQLLQRPARAYPEEVAQEIRALAALPVEHRLAFLGLLEPLLTHSQPAIRAAALTALGGAHGIPAWQRLVAGLNDPAPTVRQAAVEALHRSAAYDQARFIHAYYHPDPMVRAQAVSLGQPPEPEAAPALPMPTDHPLERIFPRLFQAAPSDEKLIDALAVIPSSLLNIAARGVVMLGSAPHEYLLVMAYGKRACSTEDEEALEALLTHAGRVQIRRWVRDRLPVSPLRGIKLARLARTFAWGVEVGRMLTGEKFEVRLLVGDGDTGFTRLKEKRIFVTGQPILRGERRATEVVRGLIIHEFGHHMYHKGPDAEEVCRQVTRESLASLYNLVLDEHLERNLRRRSSHYGDMLKTLDAYMFLHSSREVAVHTLLERLGDRAAEVLTRIPLGAARKPNHVLVPSGRLLRALEGAGHSFARFIRALRTGLGNRSGDPKVAEGLQLFNSGFRKSTMPQLLDIARKLRAIFGDETNILQQLGQDGLMSDDDADTLQADQGISPEDVDQAVNDLLPGAHREKDTGGSRSINRAPEESFDPITRIEKLQADPAEHAHLARKVAPAARQLRRYFQDLGRVRRPQRCRLQGRQLDRGRLRDLLLRADPRVLIARPTEQLTDLFLGVAIDCSGSMSGTKIEKARHFGVLLAEALRGQSRIDLRLFGFEHDVLWDAGDARNCAVHRLRANGGNNDAAALAHLAALARRSRRQARLLVMVSDGMPSNCTVNALKALVRRLTRQRYCCAQVAVESIKDICFPHYVLLEGDLQSTVRRFGKTVASLVSQALGQG